jgi:hypothetical protein
MALIDADFSVSYKKNHLQTGMAGRFRKCPGRRTALPLFLAGKFASTDGERSVSLAYLQN